MPKSFSESFLWPSLPFRFLIIEFKALNSRVYQFNGLVCQLNCPILVLKVISKDFVFSTSYFATAFSPRLKWLESSCQFGCWLKFEFRVWQWLTFKCVDCGDGCESDNSYRAFAVPLCAPNNSIWSFLVNLNILSSYNRSWISFNCPVDSKRAWRFLSLSSLISRLNFCTRDVPSPEILSSAPSILLGQKDLLYM